MLARYAFGIVFTWAMWVAPAAGADVNLDDVYDNQVTMTANLLKATPEGFRMACRGLDGLFTKSDDLTKCERGDTLLAVGFRGDTATLAMIAYPSTDENIQGLRRKAREHFGAPDATEKNEWLWRLASGVVASAGYDDEYSSFVLARAHSK
ncbi:MAG: hypothetical protein WBG86_08400 [Polyangiales bacterium]